MSAIYLYSLADAKSTQVTDGMSDAENPVFDKNGKYLYFTASTNSGAAMQPDIESFVAAGDGECISGGAGQDRTVSAGARERRREKEGRREERRREERRRQEGRRQERRQGQERGKGRE